VPRAASRPLPRRSCRTLGSAKSEFRIVGEQALGCARNPIRSLVRLALQSRLCRHCCRRQGRAPFPVRGGAVYRFIRWGLPSFGGLLTFRLLPKAPRRESALGCPSVGGQLNSGTRRQTARHSASATLLFAISSFPGCSQSAAEAHLPAMEQSAQKEMQGRFISNCGLFLVCRARQPNPSIERTFQRPLRALWPAAHVER